MQLRRQFAKGVDAGRGDTALKRAETRRSRGRSFVTRGLTAALLAVFAVLLALPVQAQTVTTLVSNTAQTAVGGSSNFLAQSFVTGTNATGYTVTEIDIRVSTASSRSTLLRVREDDGGEPGTLVATFMNPASPTSNSLNTFTAPANTTLEASTTYWVSVNEGISSSRMSYSATSGDDETGEMGWSIGNDRLWRGSETDNWEADTVNLVFAIKGTAAAPGPTVVPNNWSLIPTGLSTGDKFRLIFLSSTKRDGSSTDIATYNTFVQTRAAAGHTDIQAYSSGFTAVGCTGDVDAVDNTFTTGAGVNIYWLNGNKVADDYGDFYDGDWDEEAVNKNELGENGRNTNNSGNYPLTGCDHDGTEDVTATLGTSLALGEEDVRFGRPNSSTVDHGPISSNNNTENTSNRPMYGLSAVFEVGVSTVPAVLVSNTGQPPADFTTNAVDHGQAFTTGSDTAGYTLNAIDIGYNDSSNTAFSASIWSTYALDKAPNTVLYSLTPPATFSPGNLTFTAPPNTTLTTGTTYIIMLALEDASGATVKRTATVNPDEDAGAAAGWSIANNYIFAISGGWGQNGAFGPLLVAVKGTVYAGSNDATLSALTVNDGTNDLTLTPAFVSGTYAYEADVGNAVTTVTLSATVNDADAEITGVTLGGTAIADTDLTDGITVPSLAEGDNEIVVTVTAENASTQAYTVTVTRVDTSGPATGKPGITGAAQVGMTLTAGTADIMDADGLTAPGYTYQWLQEGSDISGQTSSTYTPTSSDIGKNIKVKVDFTDDASNAESLTSDETTAVVPAAITCPTDTTWCSILTTGYETPDSDDEFLLGLGTTVGTPSESFGSLDDATFTHLGLSYTVTQFLVDSSGGSSVFATSPNLPDDGAGLTLSVQQVSGQRDIPLSGNDYGTLPYLHTATKAWKFGLALNATVSDPTTAPLLRGFVRPYNPYDHQTDEDTEVTIWLTFANRTAAGAPAIRGTAQVGETLTAGIGDIADVDGLPTTFPGDYTFQWLRVDADGVSNQTLIGTDATTYTPVAADTGKKIKVQVTFTDGGGTAETLTSVAYPSSGTVLAATRTVSISADKTSAVFREDSITYTLTRTGSTTAALPVSVTLTQTKNFLATTDLTKTVTIPAGQSTETFTVASSSFQHFPVGDVVEGGTLTATVQDVLGYDLGTPSSVAVNIVIGPMIRIENASYNVNEADGSLTVKVIARTGPGAPQPTANSSGVDIFFEDVTAIQNTDYSTIQGNNFLFEHSNFSMDGTEWQAEKTYIISVTNDDIDEDDETFLLNLKYVHNNFGKNMIVDASGNACDSVDGCEVTVTITDDDTAGVTVSKSAVTVTEQDTTGDTYTVVLDSQPTANVTITIGGQSAADITATPTPLTFTTTNWATAQTVTVTAGNDTDTATDTHSLTHSSASSDTDYSGISIASVTVTVNDNDTANSAPTFPTTTADRTIAENTAAGQNVGGTFTATDSDGDTITYTIEGTDAASFNLITTTDPAAQIQTKSGVTYNYEVKAAYTVTLKADDGNGGTDTVTVNITLTDVNEPPGTPAAPSVSGTSGSTTSLTVNWSAPTNTGPDINSYDLQYRQGTSGSFSNGPQNVNGLTTTIPNLSVNTSYQVQVRATNDEGNSPWSPSGTGSTDSLPVTPPGKVFGVNITSGDRILQVNWTQVSGATGYKVQWKSGGQSYNSSRQATISSGSTASRTISSLNNGTEYTVRVIATKTGASDGIPSDDANGTPTAAITSPTAPRGLNATAVGNTRINLSWNAPASDGGSPITGYKIEVSSNGNSWTTRVANTGSANRTYSHTGLSTGDTRHYRVSAINSSGTGPHSNVARASTGLPVVSIASASTTEGQDIVFTVTISPPISGFRRLSYGTGSDSIPSGSKAATAGTDYVTPHTASKVIQIGYGLTSVEIRFRTIDDDLVEGTEVFGIGLYGSGDEGRDYTVGTRTVIGTIRDNDNNGQRYVDTVRGNSSTSASISAGGSVTGRIEEVSDADWYRTSLTAGHCYRIGVAGSSDSDSLTLPYPALYGVHKSDSTRISGTSARADYAGNKAISHVKLDTTGTYYISVGVHRFLGEGTYRLSLRDLGTSDTSCGAAKLAGPVQISVADVSREESESTRTYLIFEVTLNRAADKEVRVSYATVDGTARAGRDYESQSGTLVFERRDRTKQIWVPVEFDDEDEETETLTLRLSNAVGGEIRRGVATGSIYDYSTSR